MDNELSWDQVRYFIAVARADRPWARPSGSASAMRRCYAISLGSKPASACACSTASAPATASPRTARTCSRARRRWRATAELPAAEECELIVWTGPSELDEAWQRAQLRRLTQQPRVVMQVDSHQDALAAVRAGLGAALLREEQGAGLRKLPFAAPSESFGVWLLTHPDLRRSGRVRALFDSVAKQQAERGRS